MSLSLVLADLLSDQASVDHEVMTKVWGDLGYDELHVDATELADRLRFNLGWLIRSLETPAEPTPRDKSEAWRWRPRSVTGAPCRASGSRPWCGRGGSASGSSGSG